MATSNQRFWQMLAGFLWFCQTLSTLMLVSGETATYAADRAEGTGEEGP